MRISDIPGIQIGNAQDFAAATGCTVVICEKGAVAGVDVRGGAPGTRETDLLRPENLVERVHAVMLAGGSAFGLDAAAGVMQFLEENGIGFDVGVARVPIVVGCVLFDLDCGDHRVRPDKAMGYKSCQAALSADFSEGSAGAGTGATVGKLLGRLHAMKGGLGTYCVRSDDLIVGALVAVNAVGDIVDPTSGSIIAGAYQEDPFLFLNSEQSLIAQQADPTKLLSKNTTIGIIVTNAKLSKPQATKVASMSHNGFARAIRPSHTLLDGDTIFALSVGEVAADISAVGALAAQVMTQAIIRGITSATPLAGYKSYEDVRLMSYRS